MGIKKTSGKSKGISTKIWIVMRVSQLSNSITKDKVI